MPDRGRPGPCWGRVAADSWITTASQTSQVAQGRYLADHIAGARLVELPGGEGLFGSDSDAVAGEIHRFLRQVQTSD